LNPFNRCGSLNQSLRSIKEGFVSLVTWDTARGSKAYDIGIFGQTEDSDRFTYVCTRGAVCVAAAAASAAVVVGGGEVALCGNKPLAEFNVMSKGNIFKVISRPLRRGFRIDPAHHGKPWGHTEWWRW
jgi:hypothetical protein